MFRLFNNVPTQDVYNVYVNSYPVLNFTFQDMTNYFEGRPKIKVCFGDKLILDEEYKCKDNATLVLTGMGENVSFLSFKNPLSCTKPGKAKVEFIHGAINVPPLDIYIKEGTNLALLIQGLAYGESSCLLLPPGSINLTFMSGGQVVAEAQNFNLESGSSYSFFISGLVNNPGFPLGGILFKNNVKICDVVQEDFETLPFMGMWYQIAAIPIPDQTCTFVAYQFTLFENLNLLFNQPSINAVKICSPEVPGPTGILPLEQRFVGSAAILYPGIWDISFPGISIDSGANFIIHRTNYCYALVGSSSRQYLYILSREPEMLKKLYKELLCLAEELGYDITRVRLYANKKC